MAFCRACHEKYDEENTTIYDENYDVYYCECGYDNLINSRTKRQLPFHPSNKKHPNLKKWR